VVYPYIAVVVAGRYRGAFTGWDKAGASSL
jgi:hypothetical protein